MRRIYLMREWQELCAESVRNIPTTDRAGMKAALDELGGDSPGGVASRLGVSRSRVYQLIEQGKLEAVMLKDAWDKQPSLVMVTEGSLQRLMQKRRDRSLQRSLAFRSSTR